MNHNVFISYSSKNQDVAYAILQELEDNDVKCWIAPRNLIYGADYGDLIADAIKKCNVFLLIFSEYSSNSRWCKGELNVAFTEDKTIIPYRIDTSPLKVAMSIILNQYHWVDSYPDFKSRCKELIKAIGVIDGPNASLTQNSDDGSLNAVRESLRNILSIENNLVESIYTEFKESYSKKRSSEVLNSILSTIGEVITDLDNSGCEMKRSDFLKTIRESINGKVAQSEDDTQCLALEIIRKHCIAASEEIRELAFSSYFLHDYDKLPTDLFRSIVPDAVPNILKRIISSELDVIFATGISSVGLIAAPFIPIGVFAVALKAIIEKLFASEETISLSEIKEVYRKYKMDSSIVSNLNQAFEKIIDKNATIKNTITEIVRSFSDDCTEKLMKIGITSLSK